jgi:hypothetical protein
LIDGVLVDASSTLIFFTSFFKFGESDEKGLFVLMWGELASESTLEDGTRAIFLSLMLLPARILQIRTTGRESLDISVETKRERDRERETETETKREKERDRG